jgi:ABC-2 type transport system permease protein
MRNIFVIAQRELKSYFSSPIAYVVLTIFIFLSGFVFNFFVTAAVESASMQAMRSAQTGQPPEPIDMPGQITQGFFGWTSFLMLLILPAITMALFSEEKKRGTIELLLTSPVSDVQIVLGKFVAAGLFYTILLLTTVVQMSVLFIFSHPAYGPILSAYLGMLLYGLAILALGMFISSLTENQIIAAILTYGLVILLWIIDAVSRNMVGGVKAVLNYLSIMEHLTDFQSGVISTSHIIFYLSLMLVGLFLTYRSLDSLRWRA